ncbi:MAG: hypothetical protein WC121_11860 [Candidatus Kapaibacterium sp.]
MSDRITDPERYGMAASSGQLTHRFERMTPADTVAAAGMAGRTEPLGLALWRVKFAGDRTAYRHAQALLCARVANVSRKRKWGETPKALRLLAHQVFAWTVFGVCPVCTGRGQRLMGEPLADGRAVLSDDLCPACHGDGATPIERAVPVQLIGRAKDIAQLLFESDRTMGDGMRYHLRGRVLRSMDQGG